MLNKIGIASTIGQGAGPASPDTVRFKHKGEDHFVVIDTDLYGIPASLIVKGMEGIKTTIPAAIRMLGMPADILRKFVTRNPAYAIKQAIRKNKSECVIFEITNYDLKVAIKKEHYKTFLNKAIKHYEALEDYAQCSELVNLKSRL